MSNLPKATMVDVPITHAQAANDIETGNGPFIMSGFNISEKMIRCKMLSKTVKMFASIDSFFNLFYFFVNPILGLPLIFSLSGYYGASNLKRIYMKFYMVFNIISLLSRIYFSIYYSLSPVQYILLLLQVYVNYIITKYICQLNSIIENLSKEEIILVKTMEKPVQVIYY